MKKLFILAIITGFISIAFAQEKTSTFLDGAKLTVIPLSKLNTISSDISPAIVQGRLYWPSVREEYFKNEYRERNNTAFYDLYSSSIDDAGKPLNKRKLVGGFGKLYHEGPISWCEKTGEMFTTLSNVIEPDVKRRMIKTEQVKLRLVIQEFVDGEWEIAEEMPFNDKRYHFAHPTVTVTGDTVIFASDNPVENKGNIDLYMTVRKNGIWSDPVNLGSEVNSAGNDMFPVLLPGGLLSFASDGREGGKGGLDIYYTTFPVVGEIKTLDNSINTVKDDFGFFVHPKKKTAYFASNRAGTDDLYMVDIKRAPKLFKGIVVDDLTNLPLANSLVELLDCNGKTIVNTTSGADGNFEMEFIEEDCPVLLATLKGYISEKKDITGLDFAEMRLKKDLSYELAVLDADDLTPIPGASIDCNSSGKWESAEDGVAKMSPSEVSGCNLAVKKAGYYDASHLVDPSGFTRPVTRETVYLQKAGGAKAFAIKNIYYDFDKSNILPESKKELDNLVEILNERPGLKIDMSSHTDARGTNPYNDKLSERRSVSALGYLLNKGIPRDRFLTETFGETRLTNQCADGVFCPENYHRLNRRTEFMLIPDPSLSINSKRPISQSYPSNVANTFRMAGSNTRVIDFDTYYTVQILEQNSGNLSSVDLKGETTVFSRNTGSWVKYYIGRYTSYNEAVSALEKLSGKFSEARVVAFLKGDTVPVNELRRALEN